MIEKIKEFVLKEGANFKDIESLALYSAEKFFLNTDEKRKELVTLLKTAWQYEEINPQNFSLNDAVAWFRLNMPANISKGCILKREMKLINELHLCFMDGDEPVLNGEYPHLVVKTSVIGEGLAERFEKTDMIIVG